MNLSPEREAELFEQNMPKIVNAVKRFMANCKGSTFKCYKDDMIQQVSLAFLLYMRHCETEEEINRFPWFSAKHEMCLQIFNSLPYGFPKSTRNFKKIVSNLQPFVSYDAIIAKGDYENISTPLSEYQNLISYDGNGHYSFDVNGMSAHWTSDVETEIDFNDFMASQDNKAHQLVKSKINHGSNHLIGSEMGVSDVAITKRLKRLKKNYKSYKHGGQKHD